MTAGTLLQQGLHSSQNLLQLNTRRFSFLPASVRLSAGQARADALVSSFIGHATDGYSLAAMVGGGLVYRLGRLGTLALGSRLLGGAQQAAPLLASVIRYGSIGVGFTGEVFAFEAGGRALRVGIGGADPNLLRWSGENGLSRGLVGAAITLGPLKGAGVFAQGQNPVIQHLFQDSAMVLAHNVSDRIFTCRGDACVAPTIAEQFVNAEATLWQMNAGMALVHAGLPALHQMEGSLVNSTRARETLPVFQRFRSSALGPQLAFEGAGPGVLSPGSSRESARLPDNILAMASNDSSMGGGSSGGGAGGGKPPSGPSGSEPSPGEGRMQVAYGLAGELVRDRLEQHDPEGLEHLKRLQSSDVVVVDGDFDHIHLILQAAQIPFTRTPSEGVSERLLEGAKAVFVNCARSFPTDSAHRLARFVERGGLLLTTDWALKHVLEVGFPGFVRHNGRSTRDEVVSIQQPMEDPLFRGFFEGGADPAWWLENSSYPIEVVDRNRVQVPVHSQELRGKYGNGSVIVRFPYGKGGVYHMISHFYLQRSEIRDARHRQRPTTYATSMGASGRTMDTFRATERMRPDIDFGTVQSATSSMGFVSSVLIEQMRRQQTGTAMPEATGIFDMMNPPGGGVSVGQLGWTPQSPHFSWDGAAKRYRYQMPRSVPQVVIGRLGDEMISGDARLSRRHATIRRLSEEGQIGYALTAHNFVTLHRGGNIQNLDREQTVWILPGDVLQLTPSVLFIFDPK